MKPPALPANFRRVLLLLIAPLLLAGCVSTNHLRDAQDAFNSASTLSNEAQLNGSRGASRDLGSMADVAAMQLQAQGLYASALHSLRAAEAHRAQLEKDGLWGVAQTLRAMTHWRLGQFDEAVQTARVALSTQTNLHPRDAALLAALPGLVQNDEAYAAIVAADTTPLTPAARDRLLGLLGHHDGGALQIIEAARARLAPNDGLQLYLRQAKLAAHANIRDAYNRTVPVDPVPENWIRAAVDELDALANLLREQPVSDAAAIVAQWRRWCGID